LTADCSDSAPIRDAKNYKHAFASPKSFAAARKILDDRHT